MMFYLEPTREEIVDFIHQQLSNAYPHNYHHFNKSRVFDELLFILLTWRTPITLAQQIFFEIYAQIKDRNCFFSWSEDQWFQFLEPGGKAHDKSRTLVKMLQRIQDKDEAIEKFEARLSALEDESLFNALTALPGIKAKSAYCVMMYALKRSVFPADAHCLRISSRIGLIDIDLKKKQDRERGQKELQLLIGGDYERCYDIHTKMIVHGQQVCKSRPLCGECCLRQGCDFFNELERTTVS